MKHTPHKPLTPNKGNEEEGVMNKGTLHTNH